MVVKYLNRMWDKTVTAAGFVLTLAIGHPEQPEIHPEHAKRTLLVTPEGVFECSRDGSATVMTFGRNNLPVMLETGRSDPFGDAKALLASLEKDHEAESDEHKKDALALELVKQRAVVDHLATKPPPASFYERLSADA